MTPTRHDAAEAASRARECEIPGTIDLSAKEGEETHYGQALFPVPSEDPNDPLRWSRLKKNTILLFCAIYSFLSTSALLGPAVYIGIFAQEFRVDPNTAAGLINYPNLAFGFGSLILVPAYHKLGRRPVMLGSLICYAAGLLCCSQAKTYSGLMAARVLQGFGSGVCEALPVQLVNDVFFLHERGKKIGWYTAALCLGATGPMYAGFMLSAGYSYNLFFLVEFAFACALLVFAFIFVEESRYTRRLPTSPSYDGFEFGLDHDNGSPKKAAWEVHLEHGSMRRGQRSAPRDLVLPRRKTFWQQLNPWSGIDWDAPFFLTMGRSFTYLLVPSVVWVIMTYGLYIGLCGLSFNFVFPIKITKPPYNWSETMSGLMAIPTIVGYATALPLIHLSDRLAAHLTKRNGMIREAEMRLGVLFPAMVVAPCGLVLFGLTAAYDLHWMGYMAAITLTQWSAYFYFTVTLAYAVDSYTANLSEMLIIMNLGKQAISFGLGLKVLDWILQTGYVKVLSVAFMLVLVFNNFLVIPFMLFGKRIRIFTAGTWLAKMHRGTAVAGESH